MPFLSSISWVVYSSIVFCFGLSRNTTKWFSVLLWGADIHAQARTKNTGVWPLRKPYIDWNNSDSANVNVNVRGYVYVNGPAGLGFGNMCSKCRSRYRLCPYEQLNRMAGWDRGTACSVSHRPSRLEKMQWYFLTFSRLHNSTVS